MSEFQDLVDSANALLASDLAEAAQVADLQAKVAAAEAVLNAPVSGSDTALASVVASLPLPLLVSQLEAAGYTVTPPVAPAPPADVPA